MVSGEYAHLKLVARNRRAQSVADDVYQSIADQCDFKRWMEKDGPLDANGLGM